MPVVATCNGGPAEIISDGVDGMLVPPSDPDALANAIAMLAAEPELRKRMGAKAAETADVRFSYDNFYRQIIDVYTRQ